MIFLLISCKTVSAGCANGEPGPRNYGVNLTLHRYNCYTYFTELLFLALILPTLYDVTKPGEAALLLLTMCDWLN